MGDKTHATSQLHIHLHARPFDEVSLSGGHLEDYSRGLRGRFAKSLGGSGRAGVRIPYLPFPTTVGNSYTAKALEISKAISSSS